MTTLLCMGFSDAAAIRKALRLAKNDINEAVALLTNERPGLHYGGYEPMESGQGPPGGHGSPSGGQGPRGGDGDGSGGGGGGGFDPPPAYHEVVETEVSCGLPRAGCPGAGLPVGQANRSTPGASLLRGCWRAGVAPGPGSRRRVARESPRGGGPWVSFPTGPPPPTSPACSRSGPGSARRGCSLRSLQGEERPGLSLAFEECVATVGFFFFPSLSPHHPPHHPRAFLHNPSD